MAGVSVDQGGGKRRSLDSEINMIPMIDLLVVNIAFLLITAVWSHMSRINADAQVPGPPRPEEELQKIEPEKVLHVEMRGEEKFTLIWKQGPTVVNTIDVPRKPVDVGEGGQRAIRFPDLQTKVETEWKANGSHRNADDKKLDQAVLHCDNKTPFREMIAVIDAVYMPKREWGAQKKMIPAFNVTFAIN